jgi:homoserine kinase
LTAKTLLSRDLQYASNSNRIRTTLRRLSRRPRAACQGADSEVFIANLKVASGVKCVLVIPEFEVSTEKARAVLPQTYSRKDAVYNIQRSALIVGALTTGNWPLLREAMNDRIHQPYRASLIPGFEEVLALRTPGMYGLALSRRRSDDLCIGGTVEGR